MRQSLKVSRALCWWQRWWWRTWWRSWFSMSVKRKHPLKMSWSSGTAKLLIPRVLQDLIISVFMRFQVSCHQTVPMRASTALWDPAPWLKILWGLLWAGWKQWSLSKRHCSLSRDQTRPPVSQIHPLVILGDGPAGSQKDTNNPLRLCGGNPVSHLSSEMRKALCETLLGIQNKVARGEHLWLDGANCNTWKHGDDHGPNHWNTEWANLKTPLMLAAKNVKTRSETPQLLSKRKILHPFYILLHDDS